jgi:hypothetical protein
MLIQYIGTYFGTFFGIKKRMKTSKKKSTVKQHENKPPYGSENKMASTPLNLSRGKEPKYWVYSTCPLDKRSVPAPDQLRAVRLIFGPEKGLKNNYVKIRRKKL